MRKYLWNHNRPYFGHAQSGEWGIPEDRRSEKAPNRYRGWGFLLSADKRFSDAFGRRLL